VRAPARQVIGTWLLAVGCSAIGDKRNMRCAHLRHRSLMIAFYVGLLVTVIGLSFGYNCGAAINPVCDLVLRLFTLIAGWDTQTFRCGRYP
jgi:glycerol uptake facilitator-like aquaporin